MEKIIQSIIQFFITNFFGENWFVGWASLASILGLGYSIIKDIAYKKIGRPFYYLRTRRLISPSSNEMENLEIKFENRKISQLSSSELFLWNGGNEIIKKEDVPSLNPFKIAVADNIEILSAEIIKTNKETNNISIKQTSSHEVLVEFEFLGQQQGVAILIVHTGDCSADIKVCGETMQGARVESIVSYSKTKQPVPILDLRRQMPYIMISYGVIILMITLFLDYFDNWARTVVVENQTITAVFKIMFILMGIIFIVYGYNQTKRNVPKNLETS